MSKRAQIFEGFWVLVTLVVLSMALGTFMLVKTKVQTGVTPNSDLMNIYNEKDKTTFFNEEYLKLAVQRAYYNVLKTGAVDSIDCRMMVKDYVEYNDKCKPVKEEFQKYLKKEIIKINENILVDNLIKLKSKDISKTISEKGYINYEVNFTYNPSVKINTSDLSINFDDFNKIYETSIKCRSMSINETKECMKNLEGWDVEAKESEKYVLYDLTTKRNYFFDGKFEPMTLKFALKSWFI